MKKLLLVFFSLFLPVICAADNMKMVTYFPVPYVSYNNLKVDGDCDVGLLGSCEMDAGQTLNVTNQANVNRGFLNLNTGNVQSQNVAIGNASAVAEGALSFRHDLDVTSIPNTANSVEAQTRATMDSLNLFGKAFPVCDDESGAHKISWKKLNISGSEAVFLVCGEAGCTNHYGDWFLALSSVTDTCNGDKNLAYECSTEDKECTDVKSTSASSVNKPSFGTATTLTASAWSSAADTCDGNKNTQYSAVSCSEDCTDLYMTTSAALSTCRCGGTASTGDQMMVSCIDYSDRAGGGAMPDNFCDSNSGLQGCWNGTPFACPTKNYYSRTMTCSATTLTVYRSRSVSCCSDAPTPTLPKFELEDCVQKVCDDGYEWNSVSCSCVVKKGTWARAQSVGPGARCNGGSAIYQESGNTFSTYWLSAPTVGSACSPIGNVVYTLPSGEMNCSSSSLNNLTLMVWDIDKYVCQ